MTQCACITNIITLLPACGSQSSPLPEVSGGVLPLLMVPVIGALLGLASVSVTAGILFLRPRPTVLPNQYGMFLLASLLILPQFGGLHSPLMRFCFMAALALHIWLCWEWYSILQARRTLIVGVSKDESLTAIEEASSAARQRLGQLGQDLGNPSLFEIKIFPHPHISNVTVILADPRATVFIALFRIELRRIVQEQPSARPDHAGKLIAGGTLLAIIAFWLASLV